MKKCYITYEKFVHKSGNYHIRKKGNKYKLDDDKQHLLSFIV